MDKAVSEWLVQQWVKRFGEIMLTMGDVQPEMDVRRVEASELPLDLAWWQQDFDCSPKSFVWAGVTAQTQMETGKIILLAAGVDSAPPSETQSTYFELIRQSMSGLAQDIGTRLSMAVSCGPGSETPPPANGFLLYASKASLPGNVQLEFYLAVAQALCSEIINTETEAQATSGVNALSSAIAKEESNAPAISPELAALSGSSTFDLLLDVEMPIHISFGRATIRLNDALKLITGSQIELDRNLTDPVELLVNNCIIARGEVVVVEGNYGVRITEIVSQKERLQQSRRFVLN